MTLAGRVIVNDQGKLISKYWRAKDALLKIPNLAIHLTTERGKFEPGTEAHTKPIITSSIIDQLFGEST